MKRRERVLPRGDDAERLRHRRAPRGARRRCGSAPTDDVVAGPPPSGSSTPTPNGTTPHLRCALPSQPVPGAPASCCCTRTTRTSRAPTREPASAGATARGAREADRDVHEQGPDEPAASGAWRDPTVSTSRGRGRRGSPTRARRARREVPAVAAGALERHWRAAPSPGPRRCRPGPEVVAHLEPARAARRDRREVSARAIRAGTEGVGARPSRGRRRRLRSRV